MVSYLEFFTSSGGRLDAPEPMLDVWICVAILNWTRLIIVSWHDHEEAPRPQQLPRLSIIESSINHQVNIIN